MPNTTTNNKNETMPYNTPIASNRDELSTQGQGSILDLIEAANYINDCSRSYTLDQEENTIQSLIYIKTLIERSVEILTGMSTLRETNIKTCIDMGLNLIASGHEEIAKPFFEIALTFLAQDIKACFNISLNLFNMGQEEASKIFCRHIIKLEAYDTDTYFIKGKSFYCLEQYDEAIKHYNRAITLDLNHVDSYIHKGQALAALGYYKEAIKVYNYAISLDAWDQEALESKSIALAQLGRTKEAIEYSKLTDIIELSSRMDNEGEGYWAYKPFLLGVDHIDLE